MKTSEQTKRAISVGLITAASAMMLATAMMFCGVASAHAQDNTIDWRYGRPGVMVVTNAPNAVTVTNIATEVSGGVANTLFGPRVTALEGVLEGGTNNWNTAYGWGDHAGLYRDIGWVPSWAEVTDKPDLFDWNYDSLTNKPAAFPPSTHTHPHTDITDPPWLTSFTEQDEIALQALSDYADTNRVVRWWNSDGNMFVTLEDGVGSVWEVTSQTNIGYIVTAGENLEPFAVGQVYLFQSNMTNSSPPSLLHRIIYTNENSNLQLVWSRLNPTGSGWLNGEWYLYSFVTPMYEKVGNWPMTFDFPLRSNPDQGSNPIYFADYSEVLLFTNLVSTFATSQLVAFVSSNLGIHTNNETIHLSTEQIDKITNALTTETDEVALAALAAHAAYWPPDATASSWFTFTTNNGAITITGYNIAGGTDVVIPDYINGWPVTTIGVIAFAGSAVTSIGGAGNVVTVGDSAFDSCLSLASVLLPQVQTVGYQAFYYCPSLASVLLPQAQMVGDNAFIYCSGLTSLYFNGNAPTIGADIFLGITPNQVTNYVTNPQATGWGDKLGGMPVVRLPMYGDAIYQAGELVATTGHVAQAIAAIPEPDLSDRPTFAQIAATNTAPYTAWTGTVTPANGTATVAIAHGNMPVLVTAAPCVLTLDPTGYGTGGVSRVSLSYYPGTNSFTFATNIIKYAETPTVDTNGWNTLLIRRVSNGAWKGVGL